MAGASDEGSPLDSYNDDDEVEDENRNPATIQINHSSSVTRAGAQRNAFNVRRITPTKQKPRMDHSPGNQLPVVLEIGTEETVMRNMDHKLTQSPSIKDLNTVTPGGSIVSLPKEAGLLDRPQNINEIGFFSLQPT